MHTPRKLGFTLIELLIVLTILSILMALLYPVFAHAREKANQATCASNLRQIGLAAMQYGGDNDGMVFPTVRYINDEGNPVAWCDCQVDKPSPHVDKSCGPPSTYIKNAEVWTCPDVPDTAVTYGLNVAFVRLEIAGSHPVRLAQISNPSETIFVTDRVPIPPDQLGHAPYVLLPSERQPVVKGRHSGLANVLWMDGHVSAKQPIASYPLPMNFPSPLTVQQLQQLNQGDILKGPYTGNAATDDYYYDLVKP